jgi:hypothetical protein
LWSEYPLDLRRQRKPPTRTSTSGRGAAEQSPTAGEERDAGARRTLFRLAVALAGVLSVLGVALFLGLRRAPRRDVRANSTSEAPPRTERLEVAPAEATYAQIGEEVTAVLASARQGAEEIRTAARGEAELIRPEEIRSAAELKANALELDANERLQALIVAASRFEARLQQLVVVFHEMTSRLDELLPTEHAASADAELEKAVAESLDEALTQRS